MRTVGGVVTELKRQYTKKGDLMARFVLEDLQASMEVFVFPRVMAEHGALLENDAVVVVRGRVDLRDERAQAGGHGDPPPGPGRPGDGQRAADLPAAGGPQLTGRWTA